MLLQKKCRSCGAFVRCLPCQAGFLLRGADMWPRQPCLLSIRWAFPSSMAFCLPLLKWVRPLETLPLNGRPPLSLTLSLLVFCLADKPIPKPPPPPRRNKLLEAATGMHSAVCFRLLALVAHPNTVNPTNWCFCRVFGMRWCVAGYVFFSSPCQAAQRAYCQSKGHHRALAGGPGGDTGRGAHRTRRARRGQSRPSLLQPHSPRQRRK